MRESLIEQLPRLVAAGRDEAERALDATTDRALVMLGEEWVMGSPGDPVGPAGAANRLICGDNLGVLASLLAGGPSSPSLRGGVDLLYIDPPYDSGTDYRARITLPAERQGLGGDAAATMTPMAFGDTWTQGTATYLAMLVPRLVLMRELLSEQGSLCVHLDCRVAHYVKLVLDELFGRDRLVNEIIWQRTSLQSNARRFGHVHDVIFRYARGARPYWQAVYEPLTERHVATNYVFRDARGAYKLADLTGRGPGPARAFGERGDIAPGTGRHWPAQGTIDALLAADGIHWTRSGRPYRKRHLQAVQGKPVQSIWTDVKTFRGAAAEALDYPTQKPEKLLARLIEAASPPGGLVVDVFAGSGTTAAVAERLGRRWLCVDQSPIACAVIRQRLRRQGSTPFLWQDCESGASTPRAAYMGGAGHPQVLASTHLHLQLHPVECLPAGADAHGTPLRCLRVALHRYAMSSPHLLGLAPDDERLLVQRLAGDGLTLLDWWAIDTDVDAPIFQPRWQAHRPSMATVAELLLPARAVPQRLRVRATDVLGQVWSGVVEVA